MDNDINLTDLVQACHQAGFPNSHRGLGAEKLWAILEGTAQEPSKQPNSLLSQHRREMEVVIGRYGNFVKDQLGCEGICANCSDIKSAECAAHNKGKTRRVV